MLFKKNSARTSFVLSCISGLFMLLVSLVINFYAGMWATENASGSVKDLVLSNIPVYDVDLIFIYGPLLLWIFVGTLVVRRPNRIPFILKSIALFVIIRSVFVVLTHIGPFPDQIVGRPEGWSGKFIFGGDLFFSAHTGLPFLMTLVFWKDKILRVIFFLIAVFFAIIVLMGHLHYSIDVLSAFFITYTIFHLSEFFFKNDRGIFYEVPAETVETKPV